MRSSRNSAGRFRRRAAYRGVAALVVVGALAITAGCSGDGDNSKWQGGGSGGGGNSNAGAASPTGPQLGATVTHPKANATDVEPLSPIKFTTQLATGATTVTVTDAGGATVKGKVTSDGKSWVPDAALKWGGKYTANVTVTGEDGKTANTTSDFTVMSKPDKLVRVSSQLGDDSVVGVAMPLIINFGRSVPKSLRDDVQRRMSVTSTPAQEGIWNWVSGTQVHYRPKNFWKANTSVYVKVAAQGVSMGSGWFGGANLTLRLKIGSATVMTVDNKTKKMTVRRNGAVIKTIPVSLGKKSTPSSSGTMVIMEKLRKTVFDTMDELGPEEGYRTDIEYAQRLTWGGEFIHAASWSVGDQGRRNVSHGCVNVSPKNAAWLFSNTKVGDPVTIKGTETKLRQGNGWTDWNISWSQYVKGSAIPYHG